MFDSYRALNPMGGAFVSTDISVPAVVIHPKCQGFLHFILFSKGYLLTVQRDISAQGSLCVESTYTILWISPKW